MADMIKVYDDLIIINLYTLKLELIKKLSESIKLIVFVVHKICLFYSTPFGIIIYLRFKGNWKIRLNR